MNNALKIAKVCDEIKDLLLSKNQRYGDSALNPIRVFSKASSTDQLLVRIDDKLSRIARGVGLVAEDEDVIQDLIGYLILLKIAMDDSKPALSYEEIIKADLMEFEYQQDSVSGDIGIEYIGSFSSRSPD